MDNLNFYNEKEIRFMFDLGIFLKTKPLDIEKINDHIDSMILDNIDFSMNIEFSILKYINSQANEIENQTEFIKNLIYILNKMLLKTVTDESRDSAIYAINIIIKHTLEINCIKDSNDNNLKNDLIFITLKEAITQKKILLLDPFEILINFITKLSFKEQKDDKFIKNLIFAFIEKNKYFYPKDKKLSEEDFSKYFNLILNNFNKASEDKLIKNILLNLIQAFEYNKLFSFKDILKTIQKISDTKHKFITEDTKIDLMYPLIKNYIENDSTILDIIKNLLKINKKTKNKNILLIGIFKILDKYIIDNKVSKKENYLKILKNILKNNSKNINLDFKQDILYQIITNKGLDYLIENSKDIVKNSIPENYDNSFKQTPISKYKKSKNCTLIKKQKLPFKTNVNTKLKLNSASLSNKNHTIKFKKLSEKSKNLSENKIQKEKLKKELKTYKTK